MKKIFVIAAVMFACAVAANAVPAKPGLINRTQPDGTRVNVYLHGDEFGHWITDADGNLLEEDADGYLRLVSDSAPKIRKMQAQSNERRRAMNVMRAQSQYSSESMTRGTRHIPVLLVAFKDKGFSVSSPATRFSNLLNQSGYSPTGSVNDFYVDNSHGLFNPVFDVYGPVRLTKNMSTYGGNDSSGNDKAPELAVYEAAKQLDADIDWSQYDTDGDGYVDMVLMYYAGWNEAEGASTNTIWPHQWQMEYSSNATIAAGNDFDGVKLNRYFCTSELKDTYGSNMCGPGTTCHEFAHSLGLPDFYDVDSSTNRKSGTTYTYDPMCYGPYNNNGNTPPYFNAKERIMLGWMEGLRDLPTSGNVVIPAIGSDGDYAYKSDSSVDGEYFIYECRGNSKWDAYIEGNYGLIVYHVDESDNSVSISYGGQTYSFTAYELWNDYYDFNFINENGSHPCFYIIPAAAQNYTASNTAGQNSGLNYSGSDFAFGSGSNYRTYTPKDWSNTAMGYSLSGISYNSSSRQVTMSVSGGVLHLSYIRPSTDDFFDGEEVVFTLVQATDASTKPSSWEWYYDDVATGETGETFTRTLGPGDHVVSAVALTAGGNRKPIEFEFTVE